MKVALHTYRKEQTFPPKIDCTGGILLALACLSSAAVLTRSFFFRQASQAPSFLVKAVPILDCSLNLGPLVPWARKTI